MSAATDRPYEEWCRDPDNYKGFGEYEWCSCGGIVVPMSEGRRDELGNLTGWFDAWSQCECCGRVYDELEEYRG